MPATTRLILPHPPPKSKPFFAGPPLYPPYPNGIMASAFEGGVSAGLPFGLMAGQASRAVFQPWWSTNPDAVPFVADFEHDWSIPGLRAYSGKAATRAFARPIRRHRAGERARRTAACPRPSSPPSRASRRQGGHHAIRPVVRF